MKINIYYGGRGIIDDPTLFVLGKLQEVLDELNVRVERFNLYELKNTITTLPASINDSDGIILATTVEWFGIGGYMQQFLDACWLYGNKEKFETTYMCPVVMSTAPGEREAMTDLTLAWELLGGLPCSGLCGYVEDLVSFELNQDYLGIIEKKAENLYRTISQKFKSLPASNKAVNKISGGNRNIPLTPQESEQLSKYAADESYVQKQREDIEELANLFRGKMEHRGIDENTLYIADFREKFKPLSGANGVYKFLIKEKKKPLILDIKGSELNCYYGNYDDPEVLCKVTDDVLNSIVAGQMSFQRAFMSGNMQVKGDFRRLRMLDQMFAFSNETNI
ncbi:MAG: SCP2 sterol-binding domain-containing protein [Lachnospiraceae bacterium]|nr:SCP2 sterol-binding domain-containing protein [Lachnospiraceae bacterium]